jgi:MFS family permease
MTSDQGQMTNDAKQPETLPAYARHLWSFGFMNAVCFTIALGSPMVLCARYLGAGESLIGFLLSLCPIFTLLQIPAARFTDRWGYQKLMMSGWRARAFMVLAMVPLPLLVGWWPSSLLLFLFTTFSLCFNVIRGFASGAWLPWVKHLIAPSLLGRYFSRESIVANIAALLTLLASAFILGKNPQGWQYAILLAISGTAGVVSVLPLAKAPAVAAPKPNGDPEPLWTVTKRVWANRDYRHLVRFAILNAFALGPVIGGFTILFLKEIIGFAEGRVVFVTTAGLLGAMSGAFFLGKYIDGTGSKPVMRVAGWGHLAFFAVFAGFAYLGPTHDFLILAAFLAIGGVLNNANGIATGRLVLNTCPREDLTVAMALSQVGISLAGGTATVAWGFILEWLRDDKFFGHESRWPFFILYLTTFLLLVACQILLNTVREEKALPTDRFVRTLLLEFPTRILGDLRGR